MTLLALERICVSYGVVGAVNNLNLHVNKGEVVCLLGANGAGKTTTLKAISGIIRPHVGTITFDGIPLVGLKPERIASLGIAHLPEGRGIFATLSVMENLEIGAFGAGIPKKQTPEKIARVLSVFPQLEPRLSQRAGTMSGGEQQMLGLARALLSEPRLLLVDELSFGLAPAIVKTLFAHVAQVARNGTGVLLVEQFVGDALAVASKAYVLEKGMVVVSGSAQDLRSQGEFVEDFYLGHHSGPQGKETEAHPVRQSVRLEVPGGLWRNVSRAAAKANTTIDDYVTVALAGALAREPDADTKVRRARRGR